MQCGILDWTMEQRKGTFVEKRETSKGSLECPIIFFFKINLFYLFIFSCVGSTCGQRGLLFFAVHRFLIAVTSLVAEPGL